MQVKLDAFESAKPLGSDMSEADVVTMSQKERIRNLKIALSAKQEELDAMEKSKEGALKAKQKELLELAALTRGGRFTLSGASLTSGAPRASIITNFGSSFEKRGATFD